MNQFYEDAKKIEELMNVKYISADKSVSLMNLLKLDKDYEHYFFINAKNYRWFSLLKQNGYFNPGRIPKDENGNFLFWDVLEYLEYISKNIKAESNYGIELLEVINNVVNFSLGKKIGNYRIWWYCVKILNNIPNYIIKDNLEPSRHDDSVSQKYDFTTWLKEWTDWSMNRDLVISDIGENLLGKFLKDDSMIPYAEAIIDIITSIHGSKGKEAFTKKEDAVLRWDPFWLLKTFEKYHKTIGKRVSIDLIYNIANKLNMALEYKNRVYHINFSINNSYYQLKNSRMEKDNLQKGEIGFKNKVYSCVLYKFSQEQIEKVDLKNDFWALHNIELGSENEISRYEISADSKDAFVLKIKSMLPKNIKLENIDKFDDKLIDLFEGLYEDYSQVWFKSIDSDKSIHISGTYEVLTLILRDIILARFERDKKTAKEIITSFLSNNYRFPIYKKIALLCIDKYWNSDYHDLFKKFVFDNKDILRKADWEVELQDLIRKHSDEFKQQLREKFLELINDVPDYYEKEGPKLVGYWQYKWLSPFKEHEEFRGLYEDAKKAAEIKDKTSYEPERSTFKGGFIGHKSPLTKEEILKKPIIDLIKDLHDFKGAELWETAFEGKPDKEGLAEAVQNAAKEDPSKFTDEIDLFNKKGLYHYVNSIFWGFRDAARDGKIQDWGKVFKFSLEYIKQPWFLNEAAKEQGKGSNKGDYIWIFNQVADLIEEGSRKDETAFDPKYFVDAENIFDYMIETIKAEEHPDTQRDAVTYALNTTLGKIIEAYIIFSLRVTRATKKKKKKKKKKDDWGKKKYNRLFDKGIEGYIWFGRYLPNITYLDKKYVQEKINFLSSLDKNDYKWKMFMEGYLTGPYVYDDLYKLMRDNYIKAIEERIFEERIDNRLVEHIALGYLRGYEDLKKENKNGTPSLFWKMINEASTPEKRDRLKDIASFFWSASGRRKGAKQGEDVSEEFKTKIIAFWKWMFSNKEEIATKLGDTYPSFLGQLAELTILFKKIGKDEFDLLMLSAPYVDLNHNATFLIEYLTQFEDETSIKNIGKIYLKVLENATPIFKSEDILLIVERIYQKGDKKDADEICNTYGRRGQHFLKDVFYKYQVT